MKQLFFVIAALIPIAVFADGTDLVVPKRDVSGTIDGAETSPDEYFTSGTLTNGLGSFLIQTYRSADGSIEEIQVLFNIIDSSSDASDEIRIYFDVDHDHSEATIDRGLRIFRLGTDNVRVTNVNLFGDPSDLGNLPSSQWSVSPDVADVDPIESGSQQGWVAEVKIDAGDLALNGVPSLMGLHVRVIEGGALVSGNYPSISVNTINSWANLKTRYPIEFVFVLDQSGSMLSQNKWVHAKQASDFFANTMSILGEPSYFNDRLGLVTFSWLCSGGDQTATAKSLASIGSFPVGVYTDDLADPISNNCTPIGQGLAEAFSAANLNATQGDETVERERGVLLLSDGLQNRPNSTFLPADTGYDPCPAEPDWNACPGSTVSNVAVSTVAFGDGDWAVDTDLLSDVQGRYLGTFATTYNLSTDVEDLKETFIDGLEDFYTTNLSYADPLANFPITSGNDKLIAIASWSTAAGAENIALERDDGGFSAVECDQSASDTDVGFAICVVNNPDGGTWRAVAGDGTFNSSPDRLFVVVDLRLRARFNVDPVQPGTGDALLLTVELKDRGQPVLHDPANHPVQVVVDIETPEEGVGTFAVTHEPRTCDEIRPQLPALDPQLASVTIGTRAPGQATTGDPDPLLFGLMNQLLETCDRTGLLRDQDAGLELRDDGTQGDQVAGDGVYSLGFTDADVEGTYVFRFNVDGTTADGERFTRTKRLAKYVRVNVDPVNTLSDSRIVQQSGDLITREYHVLPQDRFGGYLGPGKTNKVAFVLAKGPGTFVSNVIDYGNGFYARLLRYDQTQGEPIVTPVVQGKPILPPEPPPPLIPWWLCLLIIFLLLVLVLWLFVYVWRLRRSGP